jgi:GT2 family glycosyltransferase
VEAPTPSVTAIVCAYTLDRWELFLASVESLRAQTAPPLEIIICIDHNDEMLKCALDSDVVGGDGSIPVTVVANRYDGRLGSARTTAAEMASGDILLFLDDDARAEPDLLEYLLAPYRDPSVVAVGGAPVPDYPRPRPVWFPYEFDWVFGCVYAGMPTRLAPTTRLIGATMSVRRHALQQIGYFHSDNHDDMDMCHRLAQRWPDKQILFEPKAIAQHSVHPDRLTWRYFWRRCFSVNRGKAAAHRNLPGSGDLDADRRFVGNALGRGVRREAEQIRRGDLGGLLRIACLNAGILLAASGYLTGVVEYWLTEIIRARAGNLRRPGASSGRRTP